MFAAGPLTQQAYFVPGRMDEATQGFNFSNVDLEKCLGVDRFAELCHYFLKNFTVDGVTTYRNALMTCVSKSIFCLII